MKMTANRRIALNIAATYARNIYTLALGLVTARWLLLSLGQSDYGLFGLVGGLIGLVTFINQTMANAVGRFYAVAIGRMKKKGEREAGLDDCRRWFTIALEVHSLIPLLLVAIGYPIGVYAVGHWLVIPSERVEACYWVWRFACLSSFIGMMNVPFRAMYTAKQEIAELTILNVLSATLNAVLLFYMVSHPGDWLAKYAFWHCVIAVLPMLFICIRAVAVYPECRIRRDCLVDVGGLKRLCVYAGWNSFAMFGTVFKSKGLMVLINLYFGPVENAAMSVATRFSHRTNTFASSTTGAFAPAIMQAYGQGNFGRFKTLAFIVSKLSGALVMLISVPLALEVTEILRLWLKNPPAYADYLCVCVLAIFFLDKLSIGHRSAIASTGRVALFRLSNGSINVLAVFVAWLALHLGYGMKAVGAVMVGSTVLIVTFRAILAQKIAALPLMAWVIKVMLPLALTAGAGILSGALAMELFPPSPPRLALTAGMSEAVMLPLVWFFVFGVEEREYFLGKLKKVVRKFSNRLAERRICE